MSRRCPALFVSAPASAQGKTLVTAALARYYRRQGLRVRVFKTGPDFLDPMILEQASGAAVYQLDLWMGGEAHCRHLLYKAAAEADLILVEGVMGLFDGTPSSADLARLFGIPVLAVINATAMAQTFGAIAHGLATYQPALPFAGVVANQVASRSHGEMLMESLPAGMRCFGSLPRDEAMHLPSRHLGLVQAAELADLEARLEAAAAHLAALNPALPEAVSFDDAEAAPCEPRLAGKKIAVARDEAFSFVYRANIELLQDMGAEICWFSPLTETALPAADAVYLPGGYPELYLQPLSDNTAMREALREHHRQGKPLVAECGGMLYLLDSLTDQQGQQAPMMGLLPGKGVMQERLANLGLHSVSLDGGELRGHTYHHSRVELSLEASCETRPNRKRGRPEKVWRQGNLHASYLHMYLPSNPGACAALFGGGDMQSTQL